MNPIEYKITLDCHRAESQVIITAKQGEASGRKITFSLNEGRLPYKVPAGVTAVLRAKKPSGAVLYNTCTVTADGNVEYIITTQTVAEVGKLPCELQLSQDGKVIFSPNFTLLVYKNLSVDSEVESSDEFTALQAAISRAESRTDGTTFTPTVSEDGVLSWTNDGGKANPDPVNITGPQGPQGKGGAFRINVTSSNGVYSADKTFDEIKAAYDAGQQPYVVLTGGTLDFIYTLAYFSVPDGTGQDFVDFERCLVGEGILETEMLRVYSYTTDSGSNVVKRIDEFKMPTSLKNPNALTFTGGATGSYDGSEPKTVDIPVIPYEVINKNTAARHSHDNKTVLDGITAEKVTEWDSKNSITDSGGYFTSDTVEGALQEIGAELAGINTLLGSGIQISFTIDDGGSNSETFSVVSGTTWAEWIGTGRLIFNDSLVLYIYGGVVATEAGVYAVSLDGSTAVSGGDEIVSGATYTIINWGG